MPKTLVVVGAGPKAAAIAAKAKVLRDIGYNAPDVVVFEGSQIGAHWTGRNGYSSGFLTLETPPEKDVGFPYDSRPYGARGADVVRRMRAEYSWPAFLDDIEEGLGYGDWIDRGRPEPTHAQLAEYVGWVLERTGGVKMENVQAIEARGSRWTVKTGRRSLDADGVVITGPGGPKKIALQPNDARILDGRSFWLPANLTTFDGFVEESGVCVVGGGGAAASIVVELLNRMPRTDPPAIQMVSSQPTIYSRGESYFERHYFSDPSDWPDMQLADRKTIIDRIDRNVVSVDVIRRIQRAKNVVSVGTRVKEIDASRSDDLVVRGSDADIAASRVIVAVGFNPWSFEALLDSTTASKLASHAAIEEALDESLAVPAAILPPLLHLPMLAGLAQGPGFPSLACLGLLADRIVSRYL